MARAADALVEIRARSHGDPRDPPVWRQCPLFPGRVRSLGRPGTGALLLSKTHTHTHPARGANTETHVFTLYSHTPVRSVQQQRLRSGPSGADERAPRAETGSLPPAVDPRVRMSVCVCAGLSICVEVGCCVVHEWRRHAPTRHTACDAHETRDGHVRTCPRAGARRVGALDRRHDATGGAASGCARAIRRGRRRAASCL